MDALPAGTDEQLDFTLRFDAGRGLLGLRQPVRVALASLERLELEVPNLRFPFDLSGGPTRFQSRRCRLREARLALADGPLRAWLIGRGLDSFGIERLTLRVAAGRVIVSFQARVGDKRAAATARVRLEPGLGRRLRAVVGEVRVYGFLPVPAPLLGMALLLGAGAQPEVDEAVPTGGLALRGVGEVELDPLDEVLWRTLVPAGWRLPARGAVRITGVRVGDGRIEVALGDASQAGEGTAHSLPLSPASAAGRCPEGEERLAQNDLDGALAAFRAAWEASAHPQLFERVVALLLASPARWDEAIAFLGADEERGGGAAAQLALATIEAERGQAAQAAARLRALAAAAREAGDREDELAALARAAELLLEAEPARATPLLERVLAIEPADGRAAEWLAERYAAEGRFAELARLEGERIGRAEGPREQAAAHARFARVLLEHLGQAARAKDELERAVRLHAEDGAAWFLLARAYQATGERDRAVGALDCVVALSADPALKADAHALAGRLLLGAGGPGGAPGQDVALARFQAALAIDPGHPDAVAGEAEIYARSGRFEDATAALERALASLPTGPAGEAERRRLLRGEAERVRARGGAATARALLERALQYGEDPAVLADLATLAEEEGRHADAAAALERLAALGDPSASLRRARALSLLGRVDEAEAAVRAALDEDARAPAPEPEHRTTQRLASEVLVAVARARGDGAGLRLALERLLAHGEDPALRVEAALLALVGGDPAEAERHLERAGDHRAALELWADLLEARGDEAALDDTLGRLVRRSGDEPRARARALVRQGGLRARGGRLGEALECYRAAVSLLPGPTAAGDEAGTPGDQDDAADDGLAVAARAGLGRIAYQLERWDEARAAWEPLHAAGLPPRAGRAFKLGEIAGRQRDPEAAGRFYRDALDAGLSGREVVRAHDALVELAEARGDSRAVVELLVEAAASERTGEDDLARSERLVRAGRRQADAGEPEGAARLLERALALSPGHPEALDVLEALAARSNDLQRAADALARRAEAARGNPRDRRSLLIRLAEIQAHKLRRPDAALATHRAILELDPDHRPSLAFLAEEARLANEPGEEERHLARLAELGGGATAEQSDVHARLAELRLRAGRDAEAEREARRALEVAPRHPQALALLDEMLTRDERLAELVPLLALRAEIEPQFERALDLDYRRAAILEQLGRRAEALAAYERIVQVRPSSAAAWERMATLHRQAGDHDALLEVLGRLASGRAAAGEPAEAAAVAVEMSHLAHDKLRDPVRSRRFLELALSYDERCALALDGLLALARIDGDVAAEDELLGRRTAAEEDPGRREALLVERARARRDRGDLDGAHALLADVTSERAGDGLLRLRIQLADQRGAPGDGVAALEELARRARRAGDAAGERELVRRLAWLWAREARRGPEAEALYQRALELDPDDVDAATALVDAERERKRPEERLPALEALVRSLRRKRHSPSREADLVVEIAGIRRGTGDVAGAAARLREALALAPDRVEVMVLLGEALYDLGEVDAAVRLLEQAVDRGAAPAAWALLGVAYEARGEADKAAAAFDRAGEAADPRRRAEALERAGREEEALALWRGLGGELGRRRAAALQLRWARRARTDGRAEAAAALALAALGEGPCEPDALALAAAGLDGDGVWALTERLASAAAPAEAAGLWRAAAPLLPAERQREALGRAVAVHGDADTLLQLARLEGGAAGAARAREAVRIAPGSVPAALALASLSREADVLPALREAWRAAAGPDRGALSVAMARLAADAGDPVGARALYRAALDEGAVGEPAATALRSLAALDAAAGDAAAAIEWLRAARARGLATVDDVRRLAGLCGEAGRHDEAVALLREAGAPAALVARELEEGGRWAELAELLERSSAGWAAPEARTALVRAAAVVADKLGDPARAAALLERALPLGPSDADLWAQLGHLLGGPLASPERAAVAYARAHAADPARTEVLVPLAEYHFAEGELEPAEDYYRRALVAAGEGPLSDERRAERGHLRLRLAQIARRRGSPAAEEALLRAAADDGNVTAWGLLATHYRELGDDARRAETLLAWAESEPSRQVELYREARPLLAADEAARIDELLVRLDPLDLEARGRVLGRLRASGDDQALERRLQEAAEHAPAGARLPLLLELGEVAERHADDERAFGAWGAALAEGAPAEVGRRLLSVARRIGRGRDAALWLEQAFADRPDEGAALLAEAWLSPGGDPDRARPFLERLLERPGAAATAEGGGLVRVDGGALRLLALLDRHLATPAAGGEEQQAPLRALRTALARHAGVASDDDEDGAQISMPWVTRALDPVSGRAPLRHLVAAPPPPPPPRPRGAPHHAAVGSDGAVIELEVDESDFEAEPASRPPVLLPAVTAAAPAPDPTAEYAALKVQLDRLPLDEVDGITALRQRLADVARRLGDDAAARGYYELVLAQRPEEEVVLRPLVEIYADAGEWERCAEVLGRLAYLAPTGEERAEWTYRQAEVRRRHLGDEEGATAGYLRAADHDPEHVPTLRRLIAIYFAEGELGSLLEVLAELERQDEPIGDSTLEAGLALSVAGEAARAAPLLERVDEVQLAAALASIRIDDARYVDQALRAALGALEPQVEPGQAGPLLAAALGALIERSPAQVGARVAAALLAERDSDVARARAHLAVLAWVDPEGEAARRSLELPPPAPASVPEEPVHPAALGPLRDALRLLGPHTIGVGVRAHDVEPALDLAASLLPVAAAFGLMEIDVGLVDEQAEPVWVEPTAPPRLLIRRDMLPDPGAVTFAAARALHLLRAGVALVDNRAEEDLAALLTAAAALFDGEVEVESSLENAWLRALEALPLSPDALPAAWRVALRQALRLAAQPGVAAFGAAYCAGERFTADRVAYLLTGDLGAGLRALAPEGIGELGGAPRRAALLGAPGPVRELLAFVFSPEGLRRLSGLG